LKQNTASGRSGNFNNRRIASAPSRRKNARTGGHNDISTGKPASPNARR
jgi:hypothetical protein